ncbi:hypothetical protein E3A20_27060, partial [Planctomyces bekefii]
GKVQIISPRKVTKEEAYQAFLSALNILSLTTVETGKVIKIMPVRTAVKGNLKTFLGSSWTPMTDEIITQIVPLKYIDAKEIQSIVTTADAAQSSQGKSAMTTDQKLSSAELSITFQWHACFLTIHRPDRGNSLSPRLIADLHRALDLVVASLGLPTENSPPENSRTTPTPVALVITASPVESASPKGQSRTWVAGGDLKELAKLTSPAEGARFAASASHFLDRLDQLPWPVIIAIDGDAIGGGAELAVAGDIRLATASSRLLWKQIRVGLATGFGSAKRLVDRIGVSRAQDLLFGEKTLTADDAHRLGLWTEVLEDRQQLENAIKQRLSGLCSLSKEALAGQKQMFWSATRSHPGAAADAEIDVFQKIWGNPTHQAFMNQFGAKKIAALSSLAPSPTSSTNGATSSPPSNRITLERNFLSSASGSFTST